MRRPLDPSLLVDVGPRGQEDCGYAAVVMAMAIALMVTIRGAGRGNYLPNMGARAVLEIAAYHGSAVFCSKIIILIIVLIQQQH